MAPDVIRYCWRKRGTPAAIVGMPSKHRPTTPPTSTADDEQTAAVFPSQGNEESNKDGQNNEGDEEEEAERAATGVIDVRRSRSIAAVEMHAVLEHRELIMGRRLSLPEEHPRSNSQEEVQTDQEGSEDAGERSDRSESIDIRRTDAPQFAVGQDGADMWLYRTKRCVSEADTYPCSKRVV